MNYFELQICRCWIKKKISFLILWILTHPSQNEVKYSDNKCSYSKNLQKSEKQRNNKAKVCNKTKIRKAKLLAQNADI